MMMFCNRKNSYCAVVSFDRSWTQPQQYVISKDDNSYRSPSPRSITEIPVRELMNAVREVILEEFSLPNEKIPIIAVRKLGFSNAGAKIAETINAILDMMLRNSEIREVNGMVSLCEH